MSTTERESDEGRNPEDPPEFDLSWRYDDPQDPEELTVFPDDPDDEATEWLTVDAGFAVPIEETV